MSRLLNKIVLTTAQMYYITYIFTMTGSSKEGKLSLFLVFPSRFDNADHNCAPGDGIYSVLLPSGISFIINVLMTVPALLWMDHWGRRPTLLVGAFFMCLWLSVNASLFAKYGETPAPGEFASKSESMKVTGIPAKTIIASTYLFVATFAPTWGPVSWVYPPELYPLRLRSKAVALCTSANWAFNFALAYFVPPAFQNITWRTYVLFAVFCGAMLLHVFFMFPETANKPLEEVEEIFDDTKPGGK